MDEGSVALAKGEIGPRSTYQKGDMFVHKKHGFLVQIIGAGEWRDVRKVKVLKGVVPDSLKKARGMGTWVWADDKNEPIEMEYNTTSLSAVFSRLGPASRVLYGEKK